MLRTFLVILMLIGLAVLGLSVRVVLKKNGRMRSMHIGDSRAMKERGIGCVQSQDREARKTTAARIDPKAL